MVEEQKNLLGEGYTPVEGDENDVVRFEAVGDFVEGYLVEKQSGQYGENYVVRQNDGSLVTIFGSAVLNTKFRKVEVGASVKVVFSGERKSANGRVYRDFEVGVKVEK